jgi:hypothetical protein
VWAQEILTRIDSLPVRQNYEAIGKKRKHLPAGMYNFFSSTHLCATLARMSLMATLLDFSLGRVNDIQAMEALSLDSEEDLFLLMARAHLPMPRLDADTTRKMAESLHALAR